MLYGTQRWHTGGKTVTVPGACLSARTPDDTNLGHDVIFSSLLRKYAAAIISPDLWLKEHLNYLGGSSDAVVRAGRTLGSKDLTDVL